MRTQGTSDANEGDRDPRDLSNPAIDPWIGPFVRALIHDQGLGGESRSEATQLLEPLIWHQPSTAVEASDAQSDRAALAQSMLAFNQRVGHPRGTELTQLLALPQTQIVVTGQQAGLFGGPVYTATKAMAASLWAQRLSAGGRPAVAVFWIASEDHDFEEVRKANFGSTSVEAFDQLERTRPVGERVVDSRLRRAISEAINGATGEDPEAPPFLAQALELGAECYPEGEPWGWAFARVLVRLLGDDCPLLLDSTDPVLKRSQTAGVEKLLSDPGAAIAAIESREKQIEASGFELQIPSARSPDGGYAMPLFLHREGCRFRVVLERADQPSSDIRYSLRGHAERGSLEDLRQHVRSHPDQVSPSALLRPVLQDAVLGSTLQILGPGELSYLAQSASLYPILGIAAPSVALRPQVVLMPVRLHQHYRQLIADGWPADLLFGPQEVLAKRLAEHGDNGALVELDSVRELVRSQFARIGPLVRALEPQLEAAVDKTLQHIDRGLDNFAARVENAAAQRAGTVRGRVARLREFALPGGKLQERSMCSLWLQAQFGHHAREALRLIDLDPRTLQVLAVNQEACASEPL